MRGVGCGARYSLNRAELGLLTDELNWSSGERITPSLRFGFAADGGWGFCKNLFSRFRSIPKKCHTGQVAAGTEGPTPDAGDTIRDRDSRQFGTVTEGFPSYTGDAVRYRDTCQAPAVREGPFPDSIYAIRNSDARQVLAVPECRFADAGNAVGDRYGL